MQDNSGVAQSKQGQLIQADFFMNSSGLNNTDTPFAVRSGQAIAGYNYEYLATGGITKRNGHTIVNASPDTQLRSLGQYLNTTPTNVKTLLRAAGTKLQSYDALSAITTDIESDAGTPTSDFFGVNTTQQVAFQNFTNPDTTVSWFAGGNQGAGIINGFINDKVTQNGVIAPVGTITMTTDATPFLSTTGDVSVNQFVILNVASTANLAIGQIVSDGSSAITPGTKISGISGSSVFISNPAVGTMTADTLTFYGALPDTTIYEYAVALHKLSTGAQGNAALDNAVVTGASGFGAAGGNTVTLNFSFTSLDTTKYDQLYIYRSSVAGATPGFTIGDLAGIVPSTTTSWVDYGDVQQTAQPVPRTGNTLLDNSILPSTGVFNTLQLWKNKLVTSSGSTLYISDINKAESWPTLNFIQVPSGGPITALGIVSYVSPTSFATDEFLVIFKEREMWTLSGTDQTNWQLLFVDYTGCVAQNLVVLANGFVFFVDYRGIFLYDGSNKPVYISRFIEYDFGINGDLDLSKLQLGCGDFFRKQNEVIWFLSSSTLGEQKLAIKLDLRLTLPNIQSNFQGRVAEAIFLKDSLSYPIYSCCSVLPTFEGAFLNEMFVAGDNAGHIFDLYQNGDGDGPNSVQFAYKTRIEDFGSIGTAKRFHKVIVWAQQSTTNDLTLNYSLNYKPDDALSTATQEQPIATQFNNPIWDQSVWDVALWDTGTTSYSPIVYNLGNPTIGIEGDALTLQFVQSDYQTPVTIIGFSVLYTISGLRKYG